MLSPWRQDRRCNYKTGIVKFTSQWTGQYLVFQSGPKNMIVAITDSTIYD